MSIVTRFAPSPTGMLHIGGVRTALFNWLYARRRGGRFILRIDDTDKSRSTPEAVDAIIKAMHWLGLDADATEFQSQRQQIHLEAVDKLLANGAAFRCHMDEAEEQAAREQARQNKQALRSPWRDRSGDESRPYLVRMRAPDTGQVSIEDAVQGAVSIAATEIDDLVLLRRDGSPTYMLASVVDDHDMQITHLIRGDDHLINTIRQTPIRQALGSICPVFAHLPLIHGMDGKKLSKRHGGHDLETYRQQGFLPAGLKNYLLQLGWSGGDSELLTEAEAIASFDLSGLGKSPARLDPAKLAHINGLHLARSDNAQLLAMLLERPGMNELPTSTIKRLEAAIDSLKHRANNLAELEQQCRFLTISRPIQLPAKAKKTDAMTTKRLTQLALSLTALKEWNSVNIASAMNSLYSAENIGPAQIGPTLRSALTGGHRAPGLESVLAWLGRDEALARIADLTAGNMPQESRKGE